MNESEHIEKKQKQKRNTFSPPRGGPRKKSLRRSFEERLRAVKLHLEEGFTQELVAREMGITVAGLQQWLNRYRQHGEEGLKDRERKPTAKKLPEAVRDKIVELKEEEPTRGVKKISQLLRRIFDAAALASPSQSGPSRGAKGRPQEEAVIGWGRLAPTNPAVVSRPSPLQRHRCVA